MIIDGDLGHDNYTDGIKLTATQLCSLANARSRYAKALRIKLNHNSATVIQPLKLILENHKGTCPVMFQYVNDNAQATFKLLKSFYISANDETLTILKELLDEGNVELCY